MAAMKVACLFVLLVVAAAPISEAAISCGTVVGSLSPCIPYLRGMAKALPPACCNGVRSLNNAAKTTPDRQTACNCIKNTASGISGINYGLAGSLPGKCGVNIPYKISPSTNCKSVK